MVGSSEGLGDGAGLSVGNPVGIVVIVGDSETVAVGCGVTDGGFELEGSSDGDGDGAAVSVGYSETVGGQP